MFDYLNNVITSPVNPGQTASATSIGGFLGIALNVLLGTGIVISIVSIAMSGMKYLTSQGDPKATDTAKKALTYSITALVLVLGAFVIKTVILNVLGAEGDIYNETPSF